MTTVRAIEHRILYRLQVQLKFCGGWYRTGRWPAAVYCMDHTPQATRPKLTLGQCNAVVATRRTGLTVSPHYVTKSRQ